ncbi:MAG TPA: signal recognition particle protein [Thermoanaerobacterales bacterium]|nr:signal recognition particle protein [Thermoanaerobacterales bacterium]
MLFEGLTQKLQETFKRLRGKGKLSESDVKKATREIRLALLEADVNFKVVRSLIDDITERAIGKEVMDSLTPGQQVIKIVNEELTNLMGKTKSDLKLDKNINVIMLVGLQGSGKTTTAGKLANYLRKQGKSPLLVGADVYRAAAIKQLQVVGEKLDIPVFTMGEDTKPVDISKAAIEHARSNGLNVVIIDTAGRLHIDEDMMSELVNIKNSVEPNEILLVVDSMTGQDAVNIAENFNNQLGVNGVILTKLDGDTRGGAALSIRAVTDCPIKFVGIGEKFEDIELFHPDRMASRILGMGDVLTLIEKAQHNIDIEKAKELEKRLRSQQFTFDDFLEQLEQVKGMGPLSSIIEMMPGIDAGKLKGINIDDNELIKIEAIIESMTKDERQNPSIIRGSRRRRIAEGSGTKIQDVNRLLKQFNQTKKLMKQFSNMEKGPRKGRLPFF